MTGPALNPVETMTDDDLRAELHTRLRGSERSAWRFVTHRDERIKNAEFLGDGTARADGVSERVALEAMTEAHRRLAARRSNSAKKSAVTRAAREEREIYRIVRILKEQGRLPSAMTCRICGRSLDDKESVDRGIGSECWQRVLRYLQREEQP